MEGRGRPWWRKAKKDRNGVASNSPAEGTGWLREAMSSYRREGGRCEKGGEMGVRLNMEVEEEEGNGEGR